LEVYRGAGEVPDDEDHDQSDTAGGVEYTLSNGGMLEEPSAGQDGRSASPPRARSPRGEADKVERPVA